MKKVVAIIALALVAGALALAPIALAGCSAQAKQEAAKDAYLAQQMDCVKKYTAKEFKTVEEMDACRAAVKEAWGLASDAGKDGGQ